MIGMPGRPSEDRGPAEPGDGPAPRDPRDPRRLATPPSARYVVSGDASRSAGPPGSAATGSAGIDSALRGPLVRAAIVAAVGGMLLAVVGAILASTAGLLFVAGLTGAIVGLVLARAAVPRAEVPAVSRRRVAWLAVGLSLAAVLSAALATWAYARAEGGTLELVDYLLTTFGPFVPAEAVIAAVTAWWGATTGPVQS